jgi:hypothetical protein
MANLTDIDLAKAQCRVTHSLEDDLITQFVAAAERACIERMDRYVYVDADALAAARTAATTTFAAASDAYQAALTAAAALPDGDVHDAAIFLANADFRSARAIMQRTYLGKVVDEQFTQAVLLLTEHYYNNRGASSVGVTVQEIPLGVDALLAPQRAQLGV